MKKLIILLTILIGLSNGLISCGQTGNLYLPKKTKITAPPPPAPDIEPDVEAGGEGEGGEEE